MNPNSNQESNPLIRIRNLEIAFGQQADRTEVVHSISFDVMEGEIVGIVGESGSGKSVTALSILGLLSQEGHVRGGSIQFDGAELTAYSQEQMRKVRGSQISYVFQEPMTSLNPVLTIGYQLEEMLILHESLTKEQRKERMLAMLEEVGLHGGAALLSQYPHQLSGGMRQRIMIAIAMICKPKLLIADEPTTALDVTVQAKILELLQKLNREHHTTILLISHDLSVVERICQRVVVMCKGDIVEQGNVNQLFAAPKEEYTKKLLKAALHVHDMKPDAVRLEAVKKRFESEAILSVKDLYVYYKDNKHGFFHKTSLSEVVKGISFDIYPGEIFGIVGESGSGKSTLAKAVVGLNPLIKGTIQSHKIRPQMVFQDPYSSLNPSKTVGWLLEEPLRLAKKFSKPERKERVNLMLQRVGLPTDYSTRYPSDLSGGQRQRVAIAMALILNQKLIVLDEAVSALDVTVQEQILELLLELRQEFGLSYLFISHDMGVIRKMCDRVGVMYQGELVEMNETDELFDHPQHPYTKQLLDAVQ